MHMNNATFGTWAGTAINDTSSVVAAGYTYSQSAGDLATIVKLSRALMIVPACLIFAGVRYVRSQNSHQKVDLKKIFPWFILWFVVASIVTSVDFSKFARSCNEVLVTVAHGNGSCWNWCKSILWAI